MAGTRNTCATLSQSGHGGNAPHETFDRSVSVQHQEAYPLSPIQHGMLFHHLRSPHAGVDIEQMVVTLREAVDPIALQRAWEAMMQRHAVFRTSFAWEDRSVPCPTGAVHSSVALGAAGLASPNARGTPAEVRSILARGSAARF